MHAMNAALPLVLLALASPATTQDDRPEAEALVNQAWLFLPTYDGEHRAFLDESTRRDTSVGAHLLAAATALDPTHVRGLWSLGHAEILLAEDDRNRGESEAAWRHYELAVAALTRSIELQSDDPWALYARGAAHTAFGANELAYADLSSAVAAADERLRVGEEGSIPWLRFKALEWRAEVSMRLGAYERARDELRTFHSEFSNNEWPLLIALAESHERARDFAGARTVLESITEKFPSDHQAYALLGYLEGLVGNDERANERLLEALEYELAPGMYTRMWMWILATDDRRAAATQDFAGFLENPPDVLSAWDLTLGRFVLGTGTVDEFIEAAHAEEARRMAAGEALDDLMCEAWFYAGLRREADGEPDLARLAYVHALSYTPPKWKWEWAYARLHFAELARGGGPVEASFADESELVDALWHVPGAEGPLTKLSRAPLPGDLVIATVRGKDGTEVRVVHVFGTP